MHFLLAKFKAPANHEKPKMVSIIKIYYLQKLIMYLLFTAFHSISTSPATEGNDEIQ